MYIQKSAVIGSGNSLIKFLFLSAILRLNFIVYFGKFGLSHAVARFFKGAKNG